MFAVTFNKPVKQTGQFAFYKTNTINMYPIV